MPEIGRAGAYARVSTTDKDQDTETQLLPIREWVRAQGWVLVEEYVDHAPAGDMARRTAWRRLLRDASRRRMDVVAVFRIDRAFRSVLEASTTLERLRAWRVGIRSYSEPWLDTTSPFGEALYYITAAYAQLERGVLSERVRAGMARARAQGRPIGRPPADSRLRFQARWAWTVEQLDRGLIGPAAAAERLGVSLRTLQRYRRAKRVPPAGGTAAAP